MVPDTLAQIRERIRSRGLIGIVIKVGGAGLMLLSSVVFARLLGPAEYGIYSFTTALLALLLILVTAGLPIRIIRDVAKQETEDGKSDASALIAASCKIIGLSSAGAVLLILVYALAIKGLDDRFSQVLLIAALCLPAMAFASLMQAILRGLRRFVLSESLQSVARPLISLAVFGLLYSLLAVPASALLTMSALFLATISVAAFAWRALPSGLRNLRSKTEPIPIGGLIVTSVPFLALEGLQVININADIFMVGLLLGPEETGVYTVGTKLSQAIILIYATFDILIMPFVANLFAQNERERLQSVITFSARLVAALTLPVALVMFAYSDEIITLLFGERYREAGQILSVLIAGQLIKTLLGPAGPVLLMCGHEKLLAKISVVTVLLNILLNLLLIPPFGLLGAAVATSISIATRGLSGAYATRIRGGIDTTVFGRIGLGGAKQI